MGQHLRVLQIANAYLGNYLYHELFAQLRIMDTTQNIFVPVLMDQQIPQNEPTDVEIVPCFQHLDRFLFYTKQKKQLEAIKCRYSISDFDVINAHSLFSGGYTAWKLHQEYGIPYVVVVCNTDKNIFLKKMIHLRKVGMKILQGASAVIFSAPSYRDSVIDTYVPQSLRQTIRDKSHVIPFGISDVFYQDRYAPHALRPNEPIRLIQVGVVNDNKNCKTTIRAVEILRRQGIESTLTIVGQICQKKYDGYFDQFDFVSYRGKVEAQQVKQLLRQSDLFVLPSHTESFGLVYPEAMSQGLPVLYTRGEGFDGHFPDGIVGYAVDDKNPHDVANKIKSVLEAYELLSQKSYENSVIFSWKNISKKYYELYNVAAEHRKGKGEI